MAKIENIHDNFFKKIFENKENVRSFLKISLPKPVLNNIDLKSIEIDPTGYVSEDMKGYFSDIVIKTKVKNKEEDKRKEENKGKKKGKGKEKGIPADIYILFEHKSYQDRRIYFQLLRYMYLMIEKDMREGKEPRVVIPLVFYHGKGKWKLKDEFTSVFNVDDEIKRYLLNYRYILFDTNEWDFDKERNEELRKNVVLLSSLLLMKSAYDRDIESIMGVFDLWKRLGYIKDEEQLIFFFRYIMWTKDIEYEKLEEIIKEKKIPGGDKMPSLAKRLYEEGLKEGKEIGIQEGIEKGIYEDKKQVAKNMLLKGLDVDLISEVTGLSKEEIREIEKRLKA